jgi:tRNA A37 threonylcarbamoyladenosine synthetase subunit TsaC/SUA5/YrdC
VVPNPGARFPWLCGGRPDRLAVRVPRLDPRLAEAIERVGAVVATSANLHGERDPLSLRDVPDELLRTAAVVVDGGQAPALRPSTVVDVSGREPAVLREGALPAADVLELLAG